MNSDQKQALYLKLVQTAVDYGNSCYSRGSCGDERLYNGDLYEHTLKCWDDLTALISEAVYGKGKYD